MRETRAELVAHVGTPSATQRAMIEQAVQLRLRIALMDRKFAETSAQTEHDSRVYLAWANSYSRLLGRLGLEAAEAPRESLMDRLTREAAATPAPGLATPPGPPTPPVFLPAGDIPDYVPPARPSI